MSVPTPEAAAPAPETTQEQPSAQQQTTPTEPAQAFTQEQVNALLAEQKRKERERVADYGDLKAKAERLDQLEEASKSEQQRAAEAAAKAQRDAAEARAETLRYKAAATHGVDPDNFDLLGGGSEEEVAARAERVGGLLKTVAEAQQFRAEIDRLTAENEALRAGKPIPASSRPVESLRPGATPPPPPEVPDDGYPVDWLSPSQRAHLERARGLTS